jgi:hypothetical protein
MRVPDDLGVSTTPALRASPRLTSLSLEDAGSLSLDDAGSQRRFCWGGEMAELLIALTTERSCATPA